MENITLYSRLDKVKSFFDNQKSLIPIILLLPTIMGGLWQILELIFIDPSFIRFFSVSQLIADGILILSLLMILFIYLFILDKQFNFKNIGKINDKTPYFSPQRYIVSIFTIGVIILYYCWGFKDLETNFLNKSRLGPILTQLLAAGFFLPLLIEAVISFIFEVYKLYFRSKNQIGWKVQFKGKKVVLHNLAIFISVITLIITLSFGILALFLVLEFRKKLIYPENFENIKQVKLQVNKEFGNQEFTIRYLNDKYIFVEIDSKEIERPKKIKIYKTDEILFR